MSGQKCMQIDFYYWGDQCPYNSNIRGLLSRLKNNVGYSIKTFDISEQPKLAEKINMYSPTLLVFDNNLRWNGPISEEIIDLISKGSLPKREPYVVKNGDNLIKGTTITLTEETVLDTYQPCGCLEKSCCADKALWIKSIRSSFCLPHLGILHYYQGSCVGGAEFVPSLVVPYPIPKGDDIAFLTCSFLSDKDADYRSLPLQVLEDELPKLGFGALTAIASEDVVFPNGTLQWFIDRGYQDQGQINYEENDSARMHLIKKNLN